MEKQFTKLSDLVGDKFTVQRVNGYKFKMWDNANKKMLVSDQWVQGYRKVYSVDTDKGTLDLGIGQMGTILESVFESGLADINLRTFEVKSNGKTGMDIRYMFRALPETATVIEEPKVSEEPEWGEEIPF